MKEEYYVLELSRGFVAIIDREDRRRVCKHSWHVHFSRGSKKKPGQPYARATIKGRKVYLHRFIMDPEDGLHVDHRNHQTLDNRKANLEVIERLENQRRRRNCNS